jgi:hypothetical protein
MDKQKISQALTTGLLAGYGGKSQFYKITRGSFELMSSHFEDGNTVYHDEWNNGGGQEIVKVGNDTFTRVYAGRAVGDIDAINQKLVFFIQQLQDKTRLFTDCELTDGDWKYQYKIIDINETIKVTTGKETISHLDKVVFVHVFVLSPVEK